MKTIKIGKERELLVNLWAIKELKKKFGSFEKMSDAMSKDDPLDSLEDIADMVVILVNASIRRKNTDINLGFIKGEKDALITAEMAMDYLDMKKLKAFPAMFAEIITGGYEADIPEKEEPDEVLRELDAKNG